MPASFNGVAGLRPTKGCYTNDDNIVPLSSTRDTPGETLVYGHVFVESFAYAYYLACAADILTLMCSVEDYQQAWCFFWNLEVSK